jgi:hypothetical protein
MKIALRYGLLITLGVMAWVIVAHTLVPNPHSLVHSFGAFAFFNLLHFGLIYLGIKGLEREKGDKPTFKEGVKLGVAISFVYAVSASLFFAGVLAIIGSKWMTGEAPPANSPLWIIGLKAFAGLILFTMIFGLIYSTLISFALAKRQSSEN